MIDSSRIKEIMKSKEKAAQRKYDNFQASGVTKYYTEYRHYDDLASICRLALSISDIKEKNDRLTISLYKLCHKAYDLKKDGDYFEPQKMKSFLEDIIIMGKQNDLLRRDL